MPRGFRTATNVGYIKTGSRSKRIRLEQNPERPFRLRQKSLIKKDQLHKSPWWWVLHRRGLRRPRVGVDPLEARAIPHSLVKGTLPERIVYKFCYDKLHFVDGIEMNFQSSLQGGRLELGGIVCDFIFPIHKIALQVQGPTHDQYARMRKDDEQTMMLTAMGYHVHHVDMDIIYNEPRFEEYMRRLFGLGYPNWGGAVNGFYVVHDGTEEQLELINQISIDASRLEQLFLTINSRLLGARFEI